VQINGMIPWKSDLGDASVAQDFDRMSTYTKKILDFDNCNDDQIKQLFEKLHKKIATINTKKWVNLFDAFIDKCVDFAPQGNYPGLRSQVIISNQVRSYIHKGLL
jgi:hypothetical protein